MTELEPQLGGTGHRGAIHLHPELCVQLPPQQLVWRRELEGIESYWVAQQQELG